MDFLLFWLDWKEKVDVEMQCALALTACLQRTKHSVERVLPPVLSNGREYSQYALTEIFWWYRLDLAWARARF